MLTGPKLQTPQVKESRSKQDLLQFNITVHLPVGDSHLRINNFETDLPLFAHDVGDLASTVEFRHLSLKGSNMPIVVKVSVPLL